MYLKDDVISYNRKTTYGKKGEMISIISNHDPAILVKSETGNCFTTSMENLSLIKIQKDDPRDYKYKK